LSEVSEKPPLEKRQQEKPRLAKRPQVKQSADAEPEAAAEAWLSAVPLAWAYQKSLNVCA
jgi:hypothetical protein